MDADGIPEIIGRNMNLSGSASQQGNGGANGIYIFNGKTGSVKYHPNTDFIPYTNNGFLLADANSNGFGEFYYISAWNTPNGNARRIMCYEFDNASKSFARRWISDKQVGPNNDGVFYNLEIADFNGDGVPEIYSGNQIFNAIDGKEICSGATNQFRGWGNLPAYHPCGFTVAVDVLDSSTFIPSLNTSCGALCNGLELVAGNGVYAVDIRNGKMELVMQLTGYPDGLVSIADYDLDGDLDAIVSNGNYNNKPIVYIWDLQTTSLLGNLYELGSGSNVGRANIGDFDNDGKPELGICIENRYIVLDDYDAAIKNSGNYKTLWTINTSDASGMTGATVFDFEGDGGAEIVYRDVSNLRILNGKTGATLASISCASPTASEYPIVADIDADGETDIVCSCGGLVNGNLVAFSSANKPWLPARKVWNQHGYFSVNINDDLTVPKVQQLHQKEFHQTGTGKRPFNKFIAQTTFINDRGNISFESTDAKLEILGNNCSGDSTLIFFELCNLGSLPASGVMPFSVYDRNPLANSTNRIKSGVIGKTLQGKECKKDSIKVKAGSGSSMLFFVLNDNGTKSRPYSLDSSFQMTAFAECNYLNNIDSIGVIAGKTITENLTICKGDSFSTATLNISGNPKVKWTPTIGVSDTTQWNVYLKPNTNQQYTLTFPELDCSNTYYFNFTVNEPKLITRLDTICQGDSFSTAILNISGNPKVKWIPSVRVSDTTQWNVYLKPSGNMNYTLSFPELACVETYQFGFNLNDPNLLPLWEPTDVCEGAIAGLAVDTNFTYGIFNSGVFDSLKVSSQGLTFNADTTIIYSISDGICLVRDTFTCKFWPSPNPKIMLNNLNEICLGDTIQIEGSGGINFNWIPQSGLINADTRFPKLIVNNPIWYYFLTDTALGCNATDSILIGPNASNIERFINSPIDLCISDGYDEAIRTIPDSIQFFWYDSQGNSFSRPQSNGLCEIKYSDGCGILWDTVLFISPIDESCRLFIPNAFTPNNNGINEMFPFFEYPNQEVVFAQCQISDFYLEIFDRWGEIIFKSTDLNKQWDGVYKGLPAMGGVYGFILRYKYFDSCDQLDRIVNTNGNFTIIR